MKDFIYAFRTLRHAPVFTLTAVLTIALGIGAATTIFSVTNAVLLRPLPYRDAARLVLVRSDMVKRDVLDFPFANADYLDLKNGSSKNFEEFAAIQPTGRQVFPLEDGTPEKLTVTAVTTNFFRMLGGRIAAGRDFDDADGEPPPPQPPAQSAQAAQPPQRLPAIAIISYDYWQRRFGGSQAIFGKGMLNGGTAGPRIVGVLAPGFELLFPAAANMDPHPDLWIANRIAYDNARRTQVSLRVIGRLREGATLDRAQSEVDLIAADLRRNFTIKETSGFAIRLVPMHRHLVAAVQPALLALMGAVIFLLLIACANVANLLLVRASLREREFAVRTALGGGWWRLVRQMLAEVLLLAAAGSAAGLGLAWLAIAKFPAVAPANLPRLDTIRIDPVVVGFAALAGLIAAAVFGLVPAIRASKPDIMHLIRGSGRTAALGGGRLLRNSVVVAEVALSFVLLIGSGLMFRSFLELQRIDPGYDSNNLLTFQLLGARGANPAERAAFMRVVKEKLSSMPGVSGVTAATPFPLTGNFNPIRWGTEQALSDPSKFQAVDNLIVLPGYFEAMHTPLVEGRTFTEQDNAPERNGVVIDTILAAKAFGGAPAAGKRILIRIRTPEPEWVQVLGVVAHQRTTSLSDPGREEIFLPDGFLDHGVASRWAVRISGDSARFGAAIRAEVAKIDPRVLITEMQPMQELVSKAQAGTRFSLLLIALFAAVAALLAAVGLYGVLSTVVRQRTAEIGVRMALGAAPSSIFQLIVGHGLALSAAGIAAGLIAAFGLTRLIKSLLIGVKPSDPLTYIAMALAFLIIAAISSWLPARRAASLDPTVALRDE